MSTESRGLPEYADLPPEIEPHVRYAHGALDRLKFATTSDARIFDIHQAREGINALLRYALAHSRAQDSGGEELTDTYVQTVPDKCDRIIWRGQYHHLPIATPQPSDAQQASRASNPADAVCDCAATVDGGSHSRDCSAYATPPTAQRHDEGAEAIGYIWPSDVENLRLWRNGIKGVRCVNLWAEPTGQAGFPVYATHGAGAAVEAVADIIATPEATHPHASGDTDVRWLIDPSQLAVGTKLYTAPPQQRSEQVAVSAAVVARALVECPISLVAESRWEWIAKYINTALSTQPLLSYQPAGVRVDAAMIERLRYALRMYDERRTTMQSLASSVGDFLRDVAVLHPEQAKDGGVS